MNYLFAQAFDHIVGYKKRRNNWNFFDDQ